MIILMSDKVKSYVGQKGHQGSLRICTKIKLLFIYAILENWITKPQILAMSGQGQVLNKYHTSYSLHTQVLYLILIILYVMWYFRELNKNILVVMDFSWFAGP